MSDLFKFDIKRLHKQLPSQADLSAARQEHFRLCAWGWMYAGNDGDIFAKEYTDVRARIEELTNLMAEAQQRIKKYERDCRMRVV